MAYADMVNIGQLVREFENERNVILVGFGTYRGTVIAAREWGEMMHKIYVPAAVKGSWESFIHTLTNSRNTIIFADDTGENKELIEQMASMKKGQRAIGVVYNPEYEMYGNYVPTNLIKRYDAFLYIDRTHHLHPLHMPEVQDEDLPETFPSGL